MQKTNLFLIGVLAVAGMLMSCNRETLDVNPDFNPETNEVNTQFVLSVMTGQSARTRMTADNVQKANNFLGITDAKLYLYATGLDAPYVYKTDGTDAKKFFDLGSLYSNGDIDNSYDATAQKSKNQTSSSNRILQLSIPLGSDAALFYGKAPNTVPGKTTGAMEAHYSQVPSETYFNIVRRIGSEDNVKAYDATARLMIFVINRIIGSSVDRVENYTLNEVEYPVLEALSWSDLGHQYEFNHELYGRENTVGMSYVELSPLAESLGQAWSIFTHIKVGEYRAGSSNAVKKMIIDLDAVVSGAVNAIPTSAGEANAKRLAIQIENRMKNYFTSSWTYQEISDIKTVVVPAILTEEQWNNASTGFKGAKDLNNYPYGDFNIPEGAAQLSFDHETDQFSYKHPNDALVTPNTTFEPRKYVYPAELAYFVNSPLRVTDKNDLSVSDFPNGVDPWDDDTTTGNKWSLGNWVENGKVSSGTRGIAVRDNINYGVALLQTSVAWSTAATTAGAVDDNRENMTGEEDRHINLEDTHFALKGILVGGVHPRLNWQYLPTSTAGITGPGGQPYGSFDGVIYDDAIANTAVPTPAGTPNYTIVFDNYNWGLADDAQSNVYVALEFQNGGDDFWGRDNVIPSGGTFYLVGLLENTAANRNSIQWPDTYQVPPIYGVDGEAVPSGKTAGMSKQIPRVFIQDFMTKATFLIGVQSLHNAFVTVPDLRSSQMSLGLSVDVQWRSGYEYEIEL